MMRSIPRYGHGGTLGDAYATRITETFTELVKEAPTPEGRNMIPGLFSWANTIPMGKSVGATPNGRRAGDPISHGANPDPGYRKDGAPTAMAVAIANSQPGWGNTAPMQMELDPALSKDEGGIESVANLIKTHFDLGGTQINLNVLDKQKVLEAHKDPSKYPDLIVRVTGFSAYFASLSPEFRQLVVDRILKEPRGNRFLRVSDIDGPAHCAGAVCAQSKLYFDRAAKQDELSRQANWVYASASMAMRIGGKLASSPGPTCPQVVQR